MKLGRFCPVPRQRREDGQGESGFRRAGSGVLALLLAWTGGCAAPAPREVARPPRDSTPPPAPDTAATPAPRPAGFLAVPIDSGAPFRRLVTGLGPDRLTLFLKLNRVDLAHVRAGDTL